jgi:hypothetical protein
MAYAHTVAAASLASLSAKAIFPTQPQRSPTGATTNSRVPHPLRFHRKGWVIERQLDRS